MTEQAKPADPVKESNEKSTDASSKKTPMKTAKTKVAGTAKKTADKVAKVGDKVSKTVTVTAKDAKADQNATIGDESNKAKVKKVKKLKPKAKPKQPADAVVVEEPEKQLFCFMPCLKVVPALPKTETEPWCCGLPCFLVQKPPEEEEK